MSKEIPTRLLTYSRQCYVNVGTCLQKRAYDTMNDIALDMHKQMVNRSFMLMCFHRLFNEKKRKEKKEFNYRISSRYFQYESNMSGFHTYFE